MALGIVGRTEEAIALYSEIAAQAEADGNSRTSEKMRAEWARLVVLSRGINTSVEAEQFLRDRAMQGTLPVQAEFAEVLGLLGKAEEAIALYDKIIMAGIEGGYTRVAEDAKAASARLVIGAFPRESDAVVQAESFLRNRALPGGTLAVQAEFANALERLGKGDEAIALYREIQLRAEESGMTRLARDTHDILLRREAAQSHNWSAGSEICARCGFTFATPPATATTDEERLRPILTAYENALHDVPTTPEAVQNSKKALPQIVQHSIEILSRPPLEDAQPSPARIKLLCDICSTETMSDQAYALTTPQVMLSSQYWVLFARRHPELCSNYQSLFSFFGDRARDKKAWCVCEECCSMFSFDKATARRYVSEAGDHPDARSLQKTEVSPALALALKAANLPEPSTSREGIMAVMMLLQSMDQ